jgi:hypothetical protein
VPAAPRLHDDRPPVDPAQARVQRVEPTMPTEGGCGYHRHPRVLALESPHHRARRKGFETPSCLPAHAIPNRPPLQPRRPPSYLCPNRRRRGCERLTLASARRSDNAASRARGARPIVRCDHVVDGEGGYRSDRRSGGASSDPARSGCAPPIARYVLRNRNRCGAPAMLNLSSARRDRGAKPFPLRGD